MKNGYLMETVMKMVEYKMCCYIVAVSNAVVSIPWAIRFDMISVV